MSAGTVIEIFKFALSSIPEDSPCFSLSMGVVTAETQL